MSSGSVSFDRAADIYDKTRQTNPDVLRRVTTLLAGELAGRGPVLEAGVGTGRIALPLHEGGVQLTGIDLSVAMMAKLVSKSGGMPFPLLAADATSLPFEDGSFGAAFAVHVLHLILGWRDAVAEMVRVVRRPGVVLFDTGSAAQRGMSARLTRQFAREAGLPRVHVGLNRVEELDEAMFSLGGRLRLLPEVRAARPSSIRENVGEMAGGIPAFTWPLDEEARRAAGERTLAWAAARFGSLDTKRRMMWLIAWRAYELA